MIVGVARLRAEVVHPYQYLLPASITRCDTHPHQDAGSPPYAFDTTPNHSRSRLLPPPTGKSREEGLCGPRARHSRHSAQGRPRARLTVQ